MRLSRTNGGRKMVFPTGKSIRLAKSSYLTGPYSLVNPKHPVTTPYTYFEAPILMPKPGNKGWMIFSERYPHEYVRFDAEHIEAEKWEVCDCNIPDSRHGAMVRLSEEEYNHVLSSFSKK